MSPEHYPGDAERLPFADASYDTVMCTFSCCAIADLGLEVVERERFAMGVVERLVARR